MGILGIVEFYFNLFVFFALLILVAVGSVRAVLFLIPSAQTPPELTRLIREKQDRL